MAPWTADCGSGRHLMRNAMDLEIDAAKSYCDLVDVEWPSSDPVIWFEAPKASEWQWRLHPKRPSGEVDEEVALVLSKTFFLTKLRNRMSTLIKKSTCLSQNSLEQDFAWPKHVDQVKQLCIPPLSSALDATVMFTNMVKSMWYDQSLVVYGFPSSNDFCINVLYTFGHLFEKVGLLNPNNSTCTTILFYSFRIWDVPYELLTRLFSKMKGCDLQDFRIYPKSAHKTLYGSVFYSFCLYMNCIHIKKEILEIIQKMTQPRRLEDDTIVQENELNQCHDFDTQRCRRKSSNNCRGVSMSMVMAQFSHLSDSQCELAKNSKTPPRESPYDSSSVVTSMKGDLTHSIGGIQNKMLTVTEPCGTDGTARMKMELEIDAAKSYCDLEDIEWPTSDPVIWFEAPKASDWRVTPKMPLSEVDEEVSLLLGKTFFLTKLRNRLLALCKRNSICFPPAPVEQNIVWPSRFNYATKLFIPALSSVKDATVMFVNQVKSLRRDQSLVVFGFPSSNDFCINVLYAFGHLFEKVGLVNPNNSTCTTYIFHSFRKWEIAYEPIFKILSSTMQIEDLHGWGIYFEEEQGNVHGSIFYSFCLYMNCILIKKQILEIIERMRQPKTSDVMMVVQEHDLSDEENQSRNPSLGIVQKVRQCKQLEANPVFREHKFAYDRNQNHATSCSNLNSRRFQSIFADPSILYSVHSNIEKDRRSGCLRFSETCPCPYFELVRKSVQCSSFSNIEVRMFFSKDLLFEWKQFSIKFKQELKLTDNSIYKKTCLVYGSKVIFNLKLSSRAFLNGTRRLRLLDFGMALWLNIENYSKHQRQILRLILSVLEITSQGQCLELRGFPLLSEFSISLIYVLAHMFERVRFYHHNPSSIGTDVIFFDKFRSYPPCLRQRLNKSLKENNCVAALVPLRLLSCGAFYQKIKNFNNSSLIQQCLHATNILNI